MLLPHEYSVAHGELLQVIATAGDYRGLVTLAISDAVQQKRMLAALSLNLSTSDDAARAILNLCVADGWTASPSWLEEVLAYVNQRAQSQQLLGLIVRVRARQGPPSTSFEKTWLNQMPFFDRTSFRPLARRLVTSTERPVLRINGPSGCGCTYTARALEEIARDYARHVTVLSAEIPLSLATVFQLEDLMDQLLPALSGAFPLPPRTGSSYPSQLVRHTVSLAMSQTQVLVFVIDGAGAHAVNDEVKLYVSGLARAICKLNVRERARLVVINHQQPLSVQTFDVREEKVQDALALQAADLERCLTEMDACRLAAGLQQLDAPIGDIAQELLAQAPSDPKTRLEHINSRLLELFES